jgi:hypothetical protein
MDAFNRGDVEALAADTTEDVTASTAPCGLEINGSACGRTASRSRRSGAAAMTYS